MLAHTPVGHLLPAFMNESSCGRISSVTSTSTWDTVSGEFKGTSDCGLDAYAIGFDVRYGDGWIYGLGLQCRTITAACSAPDGLAVPYTPVPTSMPVQETPAPSGYLVLIPANTTGGQGWYYFRPYPLCSLPIFCLGVKTRGKGVFHFESFP